MDCPACHAPARETEQICPRCGFSIEMADKHFGAVPRLRSGVSDLCGVLSPNETRRLERHLGKFARNFPQLNANIALMELDPRIPFRTYLFWLFNRAGLSSQMDRGSANKTILLAVDVQGRRAGITIGYGLEPFVSIKLLDHATDAGTKFFQQNRWGDGLIAIWDVLAAELQAFCEKIPLRYGIDLEECLENDSKFRQHQESGRDGAY